MREKTGKKKKGSQPSSEEKLSKWAGISESNILKALPFTLLDGKTCEGVIGVTSDKTLKYAEGMKILEIDNRDIDCFEFDDGFGCSGISLKLKDGRRTALCLADMRFKSLYIAEIEELTFSATGKKSAFGSTKKIFSDKKISFGPMGGPGGGPDWRPGPGGPGGQGGGNKKPDKRGNYGASCPKCGRPYRPGSNKCIRCDKEKGRIKWLWSMIQSEKWLIAISVILFFAVTALGLVGPRINRIMVDDYITAPGGADIAGFVLILFALLGLNAAQKIISCVRTLLMNRIGERVTVMLRKTVFDKIGKMSVAGINRMTAGELMQRVLRDSEIIKNALTDIFPELIERGLTLIGVFTLMMIYDWRLALLTVLPVPFVMVAWRLITRKMHHIYHRQWQTASSSRSILHDIFSGIRVVKAYGSEDSEVEKYDKVISKERDIQIKNEKFFGKIMPFFNFFMGFGQFFIMYYVGNQILGGNMTFGQMTEFSTYASMIYGPLRWLSNLPRRIVMTSNSLSKIYDVIEDEDMLSVGDELAIDIKGGIRFENVGFGYEKGAAVLDSVDLDIKPGERIGIVGRSGVGKSTMINLIMRMYDVDNGRILIDGVNIKDLSQNSLRSQMGVVLQETFLFSGSVYDNIVYARPDATRDEVIAAAKAAGAHKFIVKMQDGYDTYVGEHGYTLSGGERQRVAIARALLRDPRILILDEATSALDTQTEKEIQDALQILSENRTTIAIAHRLSTLRNCTRIIVIDEGVIAESGDHNELMNKKGIYYGLVMAQRQMFRMTK